MPVPALPLAAVADGVIVTIRLTPRAGRDALAGLSRTAGPRGEETALAAQVSAIPADNAANEALLRLLAKSWRLPASTFSVTSGARSRIKRVLVRGTPEKLIPLISGMIDAA